jgi:hypothetical protein
MTSAIDIIEMWALDQLAASKFNDIIDLYHLDLISDCFVPSRLSPVISCIVKLLGAPSTY